MVLWFRNRYSLKNSDPKCVIFHVPNGGSRNKHEGSTLKTMGVLAGVSDLIVIIPNKTIYIEVKDEKGNQSDKQIEFETLVKSLGFDYYLVRNLEQFQSVIRLHL